LNLRILYRDVIEIDSLASCQADKIVFVHLVLEVVEVIVQ